MLLKHIVFTVTNDLSYDQRMQRICNSLSANGYYVLLVGRRSGTSRTLTKEIYQQKRLNIFFEKRFLFYAEYNIRLFFYLLFVKMDAVCAIDLDTILPCFFVSALRNKIRIYDAHELFTEMKEIITRPVVKKIWTSVEKFSVPKFKLGYTVSGLIAEELKKRYNVSYNVIRNLPMASNTIPLPESQGKIILYQGAVNEARGLESLVSAMQNVEASLHIYGDGNIYNKIEQLIREKKVQNKVTLKGKVTPVELRLITQQAFIGINLVQPFGLNQVYSLANKFFDYIQAGIPQLTMNFPEYKKINDVFEIALLINSINENEISSALNLLLNDAVLYNKLRENCFKARKELNWQKEEQKLILFYKNIFA